MNIESTDCCGMMILEGVRGFVFPGVWTKREFFSELQETLANDFDHTRDWVWPTVLVFTDAKHPGWTNKTAGDQFAAWIAKKDLGMVTSTPWRKNHNTDNNIKVWMWHPKTDACERLARSYLLQLDKRDGINRDEEDYR